MSKNKNKRTTKAPKYSRKIRDKVFNNEIEIIPTNSQVDLLCITSMKEYQSLSLEELRYYDHLNPEPLQYSTTTIKKRNPKDTEILQSISAMEKYKDLSVEEMRLNYKKRNANKSSNNSGVGGKSTSNNIYQNLKLDPVKYSPLRVYLESDDENDCTLIEMANYTYRKTTTNTNSSYSNQTVTLVTITALEKYSQFSLEEMRFRDLNRKTRYKPLKCNKRSSSELIWAITAKKGHQGKSFEELRLEFLLKQSNLQK
ncbi:nuclear pore complex protein nup98-nup96 [Anaeramoeba flamelloides]|uniref:Nuclear pore complex protein nup98-nup96 n=1 Tax=Anaeramoeba flamelloides TaxID=1746091 RepID=A0AAV7YEN8_9EUKA|nr:nuclear pore complex protein nup98-nup96 [Anaeramoeba flamelloides]|eukprot:Anaeramoba_flamelloidesa1059432_16.p1 GENE.a1059432_16~~a1059432_16.p1  ORF type:complete len:256 (-),score=44.06 a1059432_16:66-833(-)